MNTNKFDIGQRIWHVHYESHGFSVLKCLVIGIESNLTDLGKSGAVDWAIDTIKYKLYPISKLEREEYLCEESNILKSSARRMFDDKEDAFHFLDTCVMNQRKALEEES